MSYRISHSRPKPAFILPPTYKPMLGDLLTVATQPYRKRGASLRTSRSVKRHNCWWRSNPRLQGRVLQHFQPYIYEALSLYEPPGQPLFTRGEPGMPWAVRLRIRRGHERERTAEHSVRPETHFPGSFITVPSSWLRTRISHQCSVKPKQYKFESWSTAYTRPPAMANPLK